MKHRMGGITLPVMKWADMSHQYDPARTERRWTVAIAVCVGTAMVIMSVLVVWALVHLS